MCIFLHCFFLHLLLRSTVDDIISWPVLSLALALNGSSSWKGVVWTILLIVAHFVILLLAVRPAIRWIVARASRHEELSQLYLFLILFVMLGNAWMVEVIGLSALIGAMEVGVLVPRNSRVAAQLSSKIEDLVVVIFLPLFFTVSGLRTQLGQLNTARLWGLTALITGATALSKICGCILPAHFIGKLGWRDSLAFGVLMNTKVTLCMHVISHVWS